jgi:hypothetical protein
MFKELGTVAEVRIDRGNRSTRRKSALVSFCVSEIPHDANWDRAVDVAVEEMKK